MRWIVDRQIGVLDRGVAWVREMLANRDISRVDWLESTSDAAASAERTADAGIRLATEESDTGSASKCQGRFRGRWSAIPDRCIGITTERGPRFPRIAAPRVTAETNAPGASGNGYSPGTCYVRCRRGSCLSERMRCFTSCATHARLAGGMGRTRPTSSRSDS